MLSSVEIVPIQYDHIKEIAKLEKICFSTPWSENAIKDAFETGTKFFIATKDNKVLGYVGISAIIDEGYITNIAVFPDYRKQGVGSALLNHLFDFAKDNALYFISLEVRESNFTAISLYEKYGFKTEGKRKNFYTNPTEDALIMTKRFD
ncbi:MAG: ribosomal-protein-alanine N-acetyltransferase [Ruminococcaceae bacterium]|nr:ribosomal-protein-alanine N-acetyltransferase [Oscillospiraceae bacterium]